MITELISSEGIPVVMQLIYKDLVSLLDRFAPHRDINDVVKELMGEQLQLWIAADDNTQMKGWMITRLIAFTDGTRRLHLDLMHGEDIDDLLEHLNHIKDWALEHGATELSANVRPGLGRKLRRQAGFSRDYEVVTLQIRRSLH